MICAILAKHLLEKYLIPKNNLFSIDIERFYLVYFLEEFRLIRGQYAPVRARQDLARSEASTNLA